MIGLIAGLWIALAQPAGPGVWRSAYPVRLGWLLVGLSVVLLLTGALAAPSGLSSAKPVSHPSCGAGCAGPASGVASSSVPHRHANPAGLTWTSPFVADTHVRD